MNPKKKHIPKVRVYREKFNIDFFATNFFGSLYICGGAHISPGDFKTHRDGHNHRHRHPNPTDFSRMSQNLENIFFYYFQNFYFFGKDTYQNIGSGEVVFNFFRSVVISFVFFTIF